MLYEMEQGPSEQFIFSQIARHGGRIPDKMLNAPEMRLGSGLYYDAFHDLGSERQMGMGLGPIPWYAIRRWARVNDLDDYQTEMLHEVVIRLDSAYMEQAAKAMK